MGASEKKKKIKTAPTATNFFSGPVDKTCFKKSVHPLDEGPCPSLTWISTCVGARRACKRML